MKACDGFYRIDALLRVTLHFLGSPTRSRSQWPQDHAKRYAVTLIRLVYILIPTSIYTQKTTQELTILVLDVGPAMHPHLHALRRTILTFLHSKLIDRVTHEVSIILYGTRSTANDLHTQFGIDHYRHITTLCPLELPTIHTAHALHTAMTHLSPSFYPYQQPQPGSNTTPPSNDNRSSSSIGCFLEALIIAWHVLQQRYYIAQQEGRSEDLVLPKSTKKRIVLISSFFTASKGDPDGSLLSSTTPTTPTSKNSSICAWLNENEVSLQVVRIYTAKEKATSTSPLVHISYQQNQHLVDRLLMGVDDSSLQTVAYAGDVAGIFPFKEYRSTHTFRSLPFEMGKELRIPVKVAYKVSVEKFPTIGKESPLFASAAARAGGGAAMLATITTTPIPHSPDVATAPPSTLLKPPPSTLPPSTLPVGNVVRSTAYFLKSDTKQENPIEDSEVVRGYRYGKELTSLQPHEKAAAGYVPEKQLQLLGFAPGDAVSRTTYMATPLVMIGNPDVRKATSMLWTLAKAMHRSDTVAIVRFISTKVVNVYVCEPVVTAAEDDNNGDIDDDGTAVVVEKYLIMNKLPLEGDVAAPTMTGFFSMSRTDRQPTPEQMRACHDLIAAMMMPGTDLDPSSTANPSLHRFSSFFMDRNVDPNAPVLAVEEDEVLQRLTRLGIARDGVSEVEAKKQEVGAALAAVKKEFPTGTNAHPSFIGGASKAVHYLRPTHVVEDFTTMMEQESYREAVGAMRALIQKLVLISVGADLYPRALELLRVMRQKCIEKGQGRGYNMQLMGLEVKFGRDATKAGFWGAVVDESAGLGPIHEEEYEDVQLAKNQRLLHRREAQEWLHKQQENILKNAA